MYNNNVENHKVNFQCLFSSIIVRKQKHIGWSSLNLGNKLVSYTLCCDAPSASIYIKMTGWAVPAALAPLVSSPWVQCMMGYIVWLVTIGCTLQWVNYIGYKKNSVNIQTPLTNGEQWLVRDIEHSHRLKEEQIRFQWSKVRVRERERERREREREREERERETRNYSHTSYNENNA